MFKALSIGLVLLGLCSCDTTPYIRYAPPDAKQDAAEIFVANSTESSFDGETTVPNMSTIEHPWDEVYTEIAAVDQSGCFTGYTMIDKSMKLHANKEAFIYSWHKAVVYGAGPNGMCSGGISFIPEKNAKYRLISASWYHPAGRKTILRKPILEDTCWLKLVKVNEDHSETPVSTKSYQMVKGNQCTRMPVSGP
jgi:hypothetical protein